MTLLLGLALVWALLSRWQWKRLAREQTDAMVKIAGEIRSNRPEYRSWP